MGRIPQAESERVRVAILEATVSEIARCGYQGLRVPAVAERIGKTQGAVYGRFAGKEALALAALRRLRDTLLIPRTLSAVAAATSPFEALEAASRTVAEIAEEHPEGQVMFARLAAETAGQDDPVATEVRSIFSTFEMAFRAILTQAEQRGELHPDLDPAVFAYAVLGLPVMFATVARMFPDATSYGAMEETLRRVLTRGIRRP